MRPAGIYIHIPFCRARCSYCDFATGAYESAQAEAYVRAVASEIAAFQSTEDALDADTIYFGGGTPSLLTPAQVGTILEAVRKRFRVATDAEVTMEMNPGTLTLEGLNAFRALGVNRASFGAQTFDDTELKRLGRTHTAADVRRTISDLRQAGLQTSASISLQVFPRKLFPRGRATWTKRSRSVPNISRSTSSKSTKEHHSPIKSGAARNRILTTTSRLRCIA